MIKKIITICLMITYCLASKAESVSADSAASIATKFMMADKRFHLKELVMGRKKTIQKISTLGKTEDIPVYYIFTGENNQGIIVVSGDDIARPILGYSYAGFLGVDGNLPPNLQDWLNDIEQQILQAREQGIQQTAEIARQWKAPNIGNVVVQLETAKWKQGEPYYLQCPTQDGKNCLTGCVTTAYAITMKYYGYPSVGRGITEEYVCEKSGVKVPSRNLGHSYRWIEMPMEYKSGQYSTEQGNCIAQLMADIGAAIQVDYSKSATSGTFGKDALFVYFGYNPGDKKNRSDYSDDEWHQMLQSDLNKSRPIIYRGANPSTGRGHTFLVDGYTTQCYYSINWGWNDSYNGFFALDALTPGSFNYNSEQRALFNFVPSTQLPCVATVNNTIQCPSLKTAIAMATDDASILIKLMADTKENGAKVTGGKNVTIDLNGHTIELYGQAIKNYGHLSVIDTKGGGKIETNNGNVGLFHNYGTLLIEGGEFNNNLAEVDSTDNRRCIWTKEGSYTHIVNGKFTSRHQVLCANGGMTIDSGEFNAIDKGRVIYFNGTSDTLIINGGEFNAIASNTNGCLWTAKDSKVQINGGTFFSYGKMVTCNGNMSITDGNFNTTGNNSVIYYYNTAGKLAITGGKFTNSAPKPEGSDYRRILWSDEGTITEISGGTFINDASTQTLCFNGNATISGGTFENKGAGKCCLSNATVIITNCMISARTVVYASSGASINCAGGFYSNKIENQYLQQGYFCAYNEDERTKTKYPYIVVRSNGIKGDVNGDNKVTITDVALMVKYILGYNIEIFNENTADINDDGEINVNDVMSTINIILGNNGGNGTGGNSQSYFECPDNHHPHLIDLGLPSGMKWACCNVGATKPEEHGGHYAWGEIEEKENYSENTYNYFQNDSYVNLGANISGTQYDVAHFMWGGEWCMPTKDNVQELLDNCTYEWVSYNGVNGCKFIGSNGGSIFLPAAGRRRDSNIFYQNSEGFYWLGTLNPNSSNGSYRLDFHSSNVYSYNSYRYDGFSVRPVYDPHEYIDLGLPSGTKWACCNLGATKPEEYGGYYAWGEMEEKDTYSWANYVHCDGTKATCHDLGNDISVTEYDVAHVKWGGKWCMPTMAEYQELVDNCTNEWITLNGINGCKFTSNINSNSIFFPAAGYRWGNDSLYVDERGYYWSSSQDSTDMSISYDLGFLLGDIHTYWRNIRGGGRSIRPIIRK